MKQALVALFAGLALGTVAAYGALPAPKPKTEAEKKADADKAAAAKAKEAADLAKAQDKAVANYKRTHGGGATPAMKK